MMVKLSPVSRLSWTVSKHLAAKQPEKPECQQLPEVMDDSPNFVGTAGALKLWWVWASWARGLSFEVSWMPAAVLPVSSLKLRFWQPRLEAYTSAAVKRLIKLAPGSRFSLCRNPQRSFK